MGNKTRDSRTLGIKVEVMLVLGGIKAVSVLTGADYGAVENWSRMQTFPSRYFLVMWLELVARGYSASPGLWGQRDLPRNKEVLLKAIVRKAMEAA